MPTTAGFVLSALFGAAARALQVRIIGRKYPPSLDRLVGYGLSIGFFMGGYMVCERVTTRNSKLLKRRLTQLREQRAQTDAFFQYDQKYDPRSTAETKQNLFWNLIDSYGQRLR